MKRPLLTSPELPHRSPIVQFMAGEAGSFKLDIELCDQIGAVACVTTLLEQHRIYLNWLEFGVVDPDESVMKLRLKGVGPAAGVDRVARRASRGEIFSDLHRFQVAPSGQSVHAVPMQRQFRLGIAVECLDRPFLTAELSRIPFRWNGNFSRISMRTSNASNQAAEGGAAGFFFEGEVRCASLHQQNQIVAHLIEWVDRQVADDPAGSPQTKVLLTDLRLGVVLPDGRPRRQRLDEV